VGNASSSERKNLIQRNKPTGVKHYLKGGVLLKKSAKTQHQEKSQEGCGVLTLLRKDVFGIGKNSWGKNKRNVLVYVEMKRKVE